MGSFSVVAEKEVVLIKPEGRLDAQNSAVFEVELQPLLLKYRFLIIDFSACSYLSSSGLRVLLKTQRHFMNSHGKMVITGMTREVYQVVEISGLNQVFDIRSKTEDAVKMMETIGYFSSESVTAEIGGVMLKYQLLSSGKNDVLHWQGSEIASLHELGFSTGIGIFAESELLRIAEAGESMFVTALNCCAVVPFEKFLPADFRVYSDPVRSGVLLNGAISFGNRPAMAIQTRRNDEMPVEAFYGLVHQLIQRSGIRISGHQLLVIAGEGDKGPVISVTSNIYSKDLDEEHRRTFHLAGKSEAAWDKDPAGITFVLEKLKKKGVGVDLHTLISKNLTLENIKEIKCINKAEQIRIIEAWLFAGEVFKDASVSRLTLEIPPDAGLDFFHRFLIRRLYSDSSHVIIHPLHGGYSAQTFHVTSLDENGRKMRPTVLKIANRDLVSREAERCKEYALPYIFNNCASVLGSEFIGDRGAMRYNFVGIGGEESTLKWLTHYYKSESIGFLDSLFDKIFLKILKPWYGQPVKTIMYPFRDHDPTLTFFPHIFNSAKDLFNISSDSRYIAVQETGRLMLNPYWFLKYEFSRLRDYGMEYNSSVCHGDLNMQNILLDESMNVYLIDFSETRPKSVVSDFARLEAIFLIDNAPVTTNSDLKSYIDFAGKFFTVSRLDNDDFPEYRGRNEEWIAKNFALARKMRKYAYIHSGGNSDPVPYFIALLEWVLPVICYSSLPENSKRLSMIVSSILCEQLGKYSSEAEIV
jgi:anti-anti-sigma factor